MSGAPWEGIWKRLNRFIRLHDKLLVGLSEDAIGSDWVEDEVMTVFEEEQKRRQTALFPVRLDDAVMASDDAQAGLVQQRRSMMAQEEPSYDVFVSYSHADREWVRGWLRPRLVDAGVRVCLDEDTFDVGVPSLGNMARAVENSRHTLLILTPAWVASEWTQFEAMLTQTADPIARQRRLLPLMLETCSPPSHIAALTYVDFRNEARREAELARLIEAIRDKLGLTEIGSWRRGAPPPEPALHTLRAAVSDFTGRAEAVQELVGHLSQDGGVVAIRGMGGVGKTELALVVAHKLADRYPDAQLLLELQPGDRPLSPEAVLANIIHAFQPELRLPDAPADLQALYRGTLAGKHGLLVLDNAAGPEQVRPLVPAPDGWAVLVTSRGRFPLPGAHLHDLGLLPADDAVALLRRLLTEGGRADLAAAALPSLAESCGYLPLALRVAAGFLTSYSDWSLAEYLAALDSARLAHLDAPGERAVGAVLGLSVTRLRERDEVLADRWAKLAVFPVAFDRAAAAAVWGTLADAPGEEPTTWPALTPLDDLTTRSTLSALVQQSLLDYEARSGAYVLHDLLRECALAAPAADLDAARLRHAWHFLSRGREAENLYLQGGVAVVAGLRQFEVVWPHLSAAWAALRDRAEVVTRRWVNTYPLAMAEVLALRVAPQERLPVLEAAVQAAAALGDRASRAAHLDRLGSVHRSLGKVRQAIGLCEEALAIRREIGDRLGEGSTLGNLGLAYWKLGELQRAVEYHKQALTISREIGDRRGEGNRLSNLGMVYAELGETQQAIEYYEQALAISREIGDRRGEGGNLGNLAVAYFDLGEMRRAIECGEQSLVIDREIGDRYGEETDLGNLGNVYAVVGEARRGAECYEQALAIARQIGDRSGEEFWLGNLGFMYYCLGEARRAIQCTEEALAISREIGHRTGEGNWLSNLGRVYAELGDGARAVALCMQSLALQREVGDRSGEGEALNCLGYAYRVSGDLARAAQSHEAGIAILREIGHKHALGRGLTDLTETHLALGDLDQAEESCREALAISREVGDRGGEALSLKNLGFISKQRGDLSDARMSWSEALRILEAIESPEAERVRRWLDETASGGTETGADGAVSRAAG